MESMFEKYLKEVETLFEGLCASNPNSRWLAEDYIGGGESKLRYLNLKIPRVRAAFKKGFSFSTLPPEDQWRIWDHIWKHSDTFEVMLLSSYWVSSRPFDEVIKQRKILLNWVHRVDNWAHSDEMSAHYARLLEHDRKTMLPIFEKWNRSKNPWLRRQSVVGLLYYSRFRKTKPKVTVLLCLIEALMEDDHYYVQKGVGWALRECWNVYPKETFMYLKKSAHRIAPAGWTAATEKLSASEKKILTELRKR
jgi:3-methyladenine DNA glycosylase AlkD